MTLQKLGASFVLITKINEVSGYKPINPSLFPKFGENSLKSKLI